MTDLQAKLAAPLDASRIRQRPNGRGGSLSYLETHDVIRTANDIFGHGKWGHEVVELRPLEAVTVHNNDKKAGVCVGYICIVRVTAEGCVATSGVGYGDAIEYREVSPVAAHELAAKEAESDALKRALKNFGDQFGLALYDKAAATAGHVTTGDARPKAAKAAPAAAEAKNTGSVYTDADVDALVALAEERGGDPVNTRANAETARAQGKLDTYLPKAMKFWEGKPVASEYSKKAVDAQVAGEKAQQARADAAQANRDAA